MVLIAVVMSVYAMAQNNVSKGKIEVVEGGKGFYYESILKDVRAVDEKMEEKEPYKRFVMDQSGMDLPNDTIVIYNCLVSANHFSGKCRNMLVFFHNLVLRIGNLQANRQKGKTVGNLYRLLGIC